MEKKITPIVLKLLLLFIIIFLIFLLGKFMLIKSLECKLDKLYDNPVRINQIYKDYTYDEYNDHVTILTYEGENEIVKIPSYINKKPVYSIDDSAFYGNQFIKEIIIPNTVIRIGHQSFIGCDNLEKVYFSNNVLEVGEWSFKVCPKLKYIYVKKGSISDNLLKKSSIKKYITYN